MWGAATVAKLTILRGTAGAATTVVFEAEADGSATKSSRISQAKSLLAPASILFHGATG